MDIATLPRRLAILSLLLVVPGRALAQPADPPARTPVVVILPFDTERTGRVPNPGTSETLAEILAGAVIEAGAFRVMDTEWLELGRQDAPSKDEIRARVAAAGVDYVIQGTISKYTVEQRRRTVGGLPFVRLAAGLTRSTKEAHSEILIRIIDAKTGEIVGTASGRAGRAHTQTGAIIGGFIGGMPGLIGGGSSASNGIAALADKSLGGAITEAAAAVIRAAERLKK